MNELIKIIRYSWSLKRYYQATAGLVIIISLLNQATPFLLKFIVDGIVQHRIGQPVASSYIAVLVGLILVANVTITLLTNIQGYIGDRLGAKLNTLLSQRYYDHVLKLPLSYFDNQVAGRITSRLDRSIVTVSELMNAFANNFIGFFLTSGITLVVLAFYSWPVALMLALLFPFFIWLTTLSSRTWQKHQQGINTDTDYAKGRFVESIGQIRAVKSFVQELTESRVFAGRRRSIERTTRVQSIGWHKIDVVRRLGLNLVFFGIYTYIVWQTFRGRYSLGTMTLLLQLATQAEFPLFASSFIVDNVQRAVAGSRDFFEVMETTPSIVDQPNAKRLRVREGRVEYRDIDFTYDGGAQVLHGVSFAISPGQKVALVGESGEGKSTVANLLVRFYEPTRGQILIDGQSINEVTQASLRSQIGVVFQEATLFSGSVAENIHYGRPQATREDLEAAATAANAHEFISKLPKGYDTEIGERGVKLSGGQKQRIAIARAVLKNAPILILDEATSSLDARAEREVQDALEKLMRGRTTLIIAHRLSTIQGVDMIVGIQSGRVAECGAPSELATSGGIYAELLALQTPTKANKARLKEFDIAKV